MKRFLADLSPVVLAPLFLLVPIGSLYWLWMAIQIKSFMMFLVGVFPPAALITAPVGAYSLIFGAPGWIRAMFG